MAAPDPEVNVHVDRGVDQPVGVVPQWLRPAKERYEPRVGRSPFELLLFAYADA